MIFSKDLVIASIKEAGNADKITPDILSDLENFEGQEAKKSNWDSLVNDTELYIVQGKDGRKIKVEKRFLTRKES